MFRTVLWYCKREKLIENGDYVLAGVSGGADSVCMLHILKKLQKEIGFLLEVVHVEHGIRGIESENDAAFVMRLCEELEIPMQLYFVDARAYGKEQKIGLEEAARLLRYDCYKKAAANAAGAAIKVALAHHADDNAETVLFQMIRGSGIDGMSGMKPKRELMPGVSLVRPLLTVTRLQIEEYLEKEGQNYCVDSTNSDTAYSRNKIRNEILPQLCQVNAKAVSHLNQSAMLLREVGEYLAKQVQEAAERVLSQRETGILIYERELSGLPEILKKELLHLAIERAAGSGKDIGFEHVELLAGLFARQTGRSISLPYQLQGRRVYEGVLLERRTKAENVPETESFFWEMEEQEFEKMLSNGTVTIGLPDGEMHFSLLPEERLPKNLKNTYTKCFDYDKIKGRFQIRTRQAKDYLIIDDAGHKKRLKEYFIHEKIPSEKRNEILLFTREDKVLWVTGYRISADVKVDGATKRILKVQLTGGKYNED